MNGCCALCKHQKRIVGRGLCATCWAHEKAHGTLQRWPLLDRRVDHCRRGHALTPDNVRICRSRDRTNPRRVCIACLKLRGPSKLLSDRRYRILKLSGMLPSEYDALLASQDGLCAVCRRPQVKGSGQLDLDHDHQCCPGNDRRRCGKCNRGLLCKLCNWALGNARDSPDRLRALADYLDSWTALRRRRA